MILLLKNPGNSERMNKSTAQRPSAQNSFCFEYSCSSPSEAKAAVREGRPDRVLPILNAWGLMGEIQIWQGEFTSLPSEDNLLLQNFASQAARAFERTQNLNIEQPARGLPQKLG